MILSIGVILFVLFVAYLWSSQGLFSAFLHFLCTLIAGAIAFALWEPFVYGALLGAREDIAWCLGLAVPFLVSLLLMRLATDRLIQGNLDVSNAANAAGGGFFGLLTGVLTAGMFVISIGFLRVPADFGGYSPVTYNRTGNIVKGSSLWLPADMITAKVYETLSVGSFGAGDSALARRNPDVHLQAGMVRMTNKGNRVALKPSDLKIVGAYEVTGDRNALVTDSFTFDRQTGELIRQDVEWFDGEAPSGSVKLWGVCVEFLSGAREDTGQVVVGPGQVRLVAESGGEIFSANPIAVISRADGASVQAGRWRFDAPQVYVASVGAGASAVMTFEFLVPADAEPIDLMIKNVRVPGGSIGSLPAAPQGGYSVESRDTAIRSLELLGMEPVDPNRAITSAPRPATSSTTTSSGGGGPIDGTDGAALRAAGVFLSPQFITGQLEKSGLSGMRLNDQNQVVSGKATVPKGDVGSKRSSAQALMVGGFAFAPDVRVVQIDVSMTNDRTSFFGRALTSAESVTVPMITDSIGNSYEPVGYIYDNGREIEIQYDASQPLRALSQIPTLSRSSMSDQLVLVYLVNTGVDLLSFKLADRVLVEFNPPMPTERRN